MLLQDIPWRQPPLVCSLGRPLGFITTSHVQKVRRAFIHCLQALADAPYDDLLWKRVCLLPTVLFIDIGKSRRADLDTKLNLILADTWPFQVGDFPGRLEKPDPTKHGSRASGGKSGPQAAGGRGAARVVGSDKDSAKQRMDYFKRIMCQGEVSNAYRAITSDAKVLPYSLEGCGKSTQRRIPVRSYGRQGATSSLRELNRSWFLSTVLSP